MKWIEPNSIQWKQDPMMRDAFELSRPTRVFSFFHVIHMFANNYHTGLIWHRGRQQIRLYFYYNTDYVGLYFVTCFLCFFFFFFSIPKFQFILMTAIDSDFKDEQNNIYSICTSIKNRLIKHRSKRSWGGHNTEGKLWLYQEAEPSLGGYWRTCGKPNEQQVA